MDQSRSQFSILGASVTAVGQMVAVPAYWSPELKTAVTLASMLLAGFVAPLVRDLGRLAVIEYIGRYRAEAERDEACKALRESQAELKRLRSEDLR